MNSNNNPSFLPFLAAMVISALLVWVLNEIAPLDTLPKQLVAIFTIAIAPYALAYFIVRKAFRSI